MGLTEIIGIIGTVISAIVKAIPFVEELFGSTPAAGPQKAAAVMGIAQTAISSVEGAVVKNNPSWAFIEPLAQNFINDAIAAYNQISQKTGGTPVTPPASTGDSIS